MSSPGATTQWPGSQPQRPGMTVSGDDGVTIRPMRLKVLYTFDDQNQTNCLARWPHVLSIQTVNLDQTTTIGVVELETCIKAVVECSPELVSRMDKDYTVYAYDYSEYDNPVVGQGMLSKALAAASPTPGAPANQSRQLITGRVCKNILGLFTNGVKDTLEVKLRLVPVPKAVQDDYFSAMEKHREMSRFTPSGINPTDWASYFQNNPNAAGMASSNAGSNQRDGRNMEVVNQLLSPSPSLLQQPTTETPDQAPVVEIPAVNNQKARPKGKTQKASRPASRTSTKRPRAKRQPKNSTPAGGNTSGYEEGTDGDEVALPRKRAKVTQTDWNNKSSLGSTPDSLRVAASTAESLRLFRPIAVSPGSNLANQDIPRAPTPVPNLEDQDQSRGQPNPPSGLRHDSLPASSPPKHISPYLPVESPRAMEDQVRDSIESPNESPVRNGSSAGSPQDICSSPPVMRGATSIRSSPPCPSSPALPQLPQPDSGFMSGSIDDLFGEEDEMERPADEEDIEVASNYNPRGVTHEISAANEELIIEEECPGPRELLPTKMPVNPLLNPSKAPAEPPRSRAASIISGHGQTIPPRTSGARSHRPSPAPSPKDQSLSEPSQKRKSPAAEAPLPAINQDLPPDSNESQTTSGQPIQPPASSRPNPGTRPPSRTMIRTASLGSLSLPTMTASDPELPPSQLQRTWTEPLFATIEPSLPEANTQAPPAYSRTSQAKRDANQRRLEDALANGEMPPFCENCGAIETPTWRKAWAQEYQGAPAYYEYSDDPGRVTAVVILGRDAIGMPTAHLIIKKFLLPEDDTANYREYYLCNPCGIWMTKYKCQRPEDRWEKPPTRGPSAAPPKKRPVQRAPRSRKPKSSGAVQPSSEANFPQSEAYLQQSDMVGQPDREFSTESSNAIQEHNNRQGKRLHPMTSDAASVALRRAIQSSPARWDSQQSPVDVEEDDNLGLTRRLLFPSPRKDGSPKVLGEVTTNVVQVATNFRSPKDTAVEVPNKENCPPVADENDTDAELLKLFEEEMARPSTPVQKTPPSNPFKTPTRPTSSHRPITRSVTRSAKLSDKTRLSPQRTPSKTPGSIAHRRSPRNNNTVFGSPLTATLNQLMSDANYQSPIRNNNGLDLDFGALPDLPNFDTNGHNLDYQLPKYDEDFFSTDIPMPSSPPRPFRLYDDSMAHMHNVDWNEFAAYDADCLPKRKEVKVKQEPDLEGDDD